jgi:site-specific DNA-methyltransferase (adenine-specific)
LNPDRGRRAAGTGATRKRASTKTSSFGSPGRASHDSTAFYASRLYEGLKQGGDYDRRENQVPDELLDRVFGKSSEKMDELPDNSVHLVVTSPPYNVGKEYDRNLSLSEYRDFLRRVWAEVERVLVPGGRCCINVANLGRRPYIPLHAFVVEDMAKLGFLMRGEVIWAKESSSSSSTAWGSWMSATNPTLRDTHEYIMIFSKAAFQRESKGRKSTIGRDEFLEFTKSVWRFDAEPARKVGHPAPFPAELPYRCIQLYTFPGDVVLDPFMGSGQTAIAAVKTGRRYVGYEVDREYVKLSERRVRAFVQDEAGRRARRAQ